MASHKSKSTVSDETENNSMYLLYNKHSSIRMGTQLLNADDVKKTNDYKLLSEYDKDSSILPQSPSYSDPSLYNMDNISSSNYFDSEEVGPTKMRFVVIIITSVAFFIQIFSQSIWSPIYEQALIAFPNWTSRSLTLLPIWGSVMTAVLVFPACLLINKYGLKVSLLWSCCFFTLGTGVRCLPSIYSSTFYLHLSAACQSAGGVVMTPLMITTSAQWFPKNERNMATGFGSAVGMLGSAATYIISPKVASAKTNGSMDPFMMRSQIMRMLYVCFGLNIFVTLLVYILFPKHTRPVSYTSKMSMASHQSAKLFHSLKILVIDFDFWCLVMAFTLSYTMSAPWSAMLPSIFSKLQVPTELSAKCGLFVIIHTFALNLSISTFADRTPGYSKEIALFTRIVSVVFLFWLMLMMDFHANLTTTTLVSVVLMAFPYCWCSQSLLYEMGAEMMFPLPESFIAGYMTLLNNFFVDIVYVILYIYPRFDAYCLHIGVFVFALLSTIFLLLTKQRSDELQKFSKN